MAKRRKSRLRAVKPKSTRGRVVRSLAKTTKGGRGRIAKRSSYKRHMR
jgi:hypothetical protein